MSHSDLELVKHIYDECAYILSSTQKTTLEKQHERRRRCHAARAKSSQCPQDATMMRGSSRRGWKGLAACGDRGWLENAWWLGVDDGTA